MTPADLAAHPRVQEALGKWLDACCPPMQTDTLPTFEHEPKAKVALVSEILAVYHESLTGEGLDFDIPEKRAVIDWMDMNDYDPNKRTALGMQPAIFVAYDAALNAQHRARVAGLEARIKELEKIPSQVWWCLEMPRGADANGIPGNNGWWYGNDITGAHLFSWDFEKAIKFRNKDDAELVMRSTHMTHYVTATDHLLISESP